MSGAMDTFMQAAQVDERDVDLEISSNCAWILEKASESPDELIDLIMNLVDPIEGGSGSTAAVKFMLDCICPLRPSLTLKDTKQSKNGA
jgi:hypothetical protein